VQQLSGVVWSWLVSCLVKVDSALRLACASSFLDTAVSGLIVVGLILGSVVLSAVLLVQIGDESRQVRALRRGGCCCRYCGVWCCMRPAGRQLHNAFLDRTVCSHF